VEQLIKSSIYIIFHEFVNIKLILILINLNSFE